MKKFVALVALSTLAACGGGGGGSTDETASTNGSKTSPASSDTNSNTQTPSTPDTTQAAATGLAISYQTVITTGGGEAYAAPTPNASSSSGYAAANQNQRSIVVGNFGGNNCPAILEAASYDVNLPQFPVAVWTSDCAGHFTLNSAAAFAGTPPSTGFITSSFAGDFNKTGRDSVLLVDSGNEIPDANGDFPGAANNHLLLNESGKLVDRSSTNLPAEGVNYNHVSTMYHLNVPGGQTLVLTRFLGHQFAGGGIEFQVNDGTGKFVSRLDQLPPELVYTAYTSFDSSVDYVQPGTALLADLDASGSPYLITGTYANGTYLTQQHAVFIYKLVGGVYQRVAIVNIPDAYKDIPYSSGQPNGRLGVSSIVTGDFEGTGRPDIAVLWEGAGITRLQIIRNNGNDSFTDASTGLTSLDISSPSGGTVAGVSQLGAGDVDGDGKDELLLGTFNAAPQQYMNLTGWRPVMHMVDGVMKFMDIHNGSDLTTQLSQLNVSASQPIDFLFANLASGKTDLLVSAWGPSVTANGFTVTNDRTFRVLLHK